MASQPLPPGGASSLDDTKQMLDELDALMERMLSLPTNELEENPAPPPPPPSPPKAPVLSATLALVDPKPAVPRPAEAPAYDPPHAAPSSPHLPSHRRYALPPLVGMAPGTAKAPPPPPMPPPPPVPPSLLQPSVVPPSAVPPGVMPRVEQLLAEAEASEPEPEGWFTLPLVWVNQRFDHVVSGWGRAGEALADHAGRGWLGFAGIAMLAGAAAWLAKDLLGWTW